MIGTYSGVIRDVVDALDDNDDFNDVVVGDVNLNFVNHPSAHILPASTTYQEDHEHRTLIDVSFIFERSGNNNYQMLDEFEKVEDTILDILLEFYNDSSIVEFKLIEIDYFGGGGGEQSLLLGFTLTFRVKQLIELDYK